MLRNRCTSRISALAGAGGGSDRIRQVGWVYLRTSNEVDAIAAAAILDVNQIASDRGADLAKTAPVHAVAAAGRRRSTGFGDLQVNVSVVDYRTTGYQSDVERL